MYGRSVRFDVFATDDTGKLFCENPAEMKHRQLAERVSFLKDNKRGVRKMCKLMEELTEELYKEELAEGRAKAKEEAEKNTLLDNIRSLMETMNMTAKQAMEALRVPAEKQEEYVTLI